MLVAAGQIQGFSMYRFVDFLCYRLNERRNKETFGSFQNPDKKHITTD